MNAEIILNKAAYGIGFAQGKEGARISGYSFYEVKYGVESYITSDMKPVLEAVTDEQYASWKKKVIIAKQVVFVWNKDVWRIDDYL